MARSLQYRSGQIAEYLPPLAQGAGAEHLLQFETGSALAIRQSTEELVGQGFILLEIGALLFGKRYPVLLLKLVQILLMLLTGFRQGFFISPFVGAEVIRDVSFVLRQIGVELSDIEPLQIVLINLIDSGHLSLIAAQFGGHRIIVRTALAAHRSLRCAATDASIVGGLSSLLNTTPTGSIALIGSVVVSRAFTKLFEPGLRLPLAILCLVLEKRALQSLRVRVHLRVELLQQFRRNGLFNDEALAREEMFFLKLLNNRGALGDDLRIADQLFTLKGFQLLVDFEKLFRLPLLQFGSGATGSFVGD
ncbi:MAG TPA: hypothetical protein VHC90_11025, partial [Bryobacteraceae bacterium]|nr:hypothetical protein [Bryobacteraceae bacterium]